MAGPVAPTVVNGKPAETVVEGDAYRDASLSDFQKVRPLGEGGMASVWEAIDRRSGERVALKEVLSHFARDADYVERFRREARAAGSIRHPHVCRVLASGGGLSADGGGDLFIAFELLTGGSLRDLISSTSPVPPQLALAIACQLLEALTAAHDAGIVHRDLKPGNVMIGADGQLKLADFGIAKVSTEGTMTGSGLLVGTPGYLSPEQAEGLALDGRSDLFALGVILHEAFTGKSPFWDTNPTASLLKVIRDRAPPLLEVAPFVPDAIIALQTRLIAPRRDDRFPDARAALEVARPLLRAIHESHGDVLAAAAADPAGTCVRLRRANADAFVTRAKVLMRKGTAHKPAAALALYRATRADESHVEAKALFATLCVEGRYRFGDAAAVDDPRLSDALAAHKKAPQAPGPLKRVADLHRGHGDVLHAASWLQRYLEVRPADSAAALILRGLLGDSGLAGSTPAGALGGLRHLTPQPRDGGGLSTNGIVAGIKTGGPVADAAAVGFNEADTRIDGGIGTHGSPAAVQRPPSAPVGDDGARRWLLPAAVGLAGAAVLVKLLLSLGGAAAAGASEQGAQLQAAQQTSDERVLFAQEKALLHEARVALDDRSDAATAIAKTTDVVQRNTIIELQRDAVCLRARAFAQLRRTDDALKDIEQCIGWSRPGDAARVRAEALRAELNAEVVR